MPYCPGEDGRRTDGASFEYRRIAGGVPTSFLDEKDICSGKYQSSDKPKKLYDQYHLRYPS